MFHFWCLRFARYCLPLAMTLWRRWCPAELCSIAPLLPALRACFSCASGPCPPLPAPRAFLTSASGPIGAAGALLSLDRMPLAACASRQFCQFDLCYWPFWRRWCPAVLTGCPLAACASRTILLCFCSFWRRWCPAVPCQRFTFYKYIYIFCPLLLVLLAPLVPC